MKKIYKKNWLFNWKAVAMVCALLFSGGVAMAQLSGTYTLDASSASSLTTKNFQSFGDFADSINTFGVSGAVTVNVTAGQSTFSETMQLNAIFGASSTNTITINGNGNKISSSTGWVININGADYVTIDNLNVENTGAASATRCYWVHNGSDYLTIKNSELTATAAATTNTAAGFVVFSASSTGRSAGNHGSYYVIDNNKMWNGGNSGKFLGSGIVDYRSSSYYGSTVDATITRNEITDFRTHGLYYYYFNTVNVSHNEIHHNEKSTSYTYGMYMYRGNGSMKVDSNNVHDIACGNAFYLYAAYLYYAPSGTVIGNRFNNINSDYYFAYGMYLYYGGTHEVAYNTFSNISSAYTYGNAYGAYSYRGGALDFHDNTISDIQGGYTYGMYAGYESNSEIVDNTFKDLSNTYYYCYGLSAYQFNDGTIARNTFSNVKNTGPYGYVNNIYFYYCRNTDLVNNLIYNSGSSGYGGYGIYTYWYGTGYEGNNIANNTIRCNFSSSGTQLGNFAGIYYYHYNAPETPAADVINNNVVVDDNNSSYSTVGIWVSQGEPVIDYNNIYVPTGYTGFLGAVGSSGYTTLAAWKNATKGDHEMSIDPEFVNAGAGDLTPQSVDLANRGVAGIVTDDLNSTTRPTCGVDVGAIEYYTDFSASNFTLSSADRCGNTSDEITFDITNSNGDYRSSLDVYYTLNGAQTDEGTDTLQATSTTTYTFASQPVYHDPGTNTVTVGIFCDDNESNNELTQSFTVVPSPSGADLVMGGTFDGYFEDGDMVNPDVNVPNMTNVYDIVVPSKYASSGTYGVDWDITNVSMTSGGMSVGVAEGIDVDETNGLIVTVDPDSSLTDSMVYVAVRVNDLNTGCDSTIGRWMYVPFTPNVQFDINDVCLGTTAQFKNRTTMGGTDFMTYKWRYNDPLSDEDTSEIRDGFWGYETYGTYDVELEVVNSSYPKFVYSKTQSITVTPTPNADFSVKNECEGIALTFTNKTTSPVSGSITYNWDFGDGNNSTAQNPTHTYAGPTAEGYPVTLTATQNGCDASITRSAYQFARPVANFSSEGACNLEEVEFTNLTTIAIGKSGYSWDFGDNGVSTIANPTHVYQTSGTHSVTLTAYSEFGCEDDVTIDVTLLESPNADFTYDATCNLTPVNFTFSGSAPAGVPTSYDWDFNGEAAGAGQNVSYQFPEVGTKVITLEVNSANGCSSVSTQEIDVVLQAVADFDVEDVCEGQEAVFVNKSSVAAGDLTYTWEFGEADDNGNSSSNFVSPRHRYTVQNATRIINIKLTAEVEGGCNAEMTKSITVNATPDASFTADADGRNLVISNVTSGYAIYSWRFGDGSRSGDEVPTYVYDNVDAGEFEVCLSVKNELCWSEECTTVSVDLVGIEDLTEDNNMIEVYPNPNSGTFNLTIENAGEDVMIKVSDILGNELEISVVDNMNGSYVVDLSNVAEGVYFVQVKNGDTYATKRITVTK